MSEKEFELKMFSEHEIRNLVAEELEKRASGPEEKHWFFEKQEQLLELIQEKLQNLTLAQQEQVLSFIQNLEERNHEQEA